MSSKTSEDRWKDLNVTQDEIERIGKALKDENFRKLFAEYAEEISDPKNREIYENEIAQMEAERGMNIQFIHPKPGHVLKVTSKISGKGEVKTFVNICQNEHIGKPSHEKKSQANGKVGICWNIPHSFSPMREDFDVKGNKCHVYDVVFHPDTYKMSSNAAFLNMVHDTALDGLEQHFGITLDRGSVIQLQNLKFKGQAQPTVMRTKKTEEELSKEKTEDNSSSTLDEFPYPYSNNLTSKELAEHKAKQVAEEKRKVEERQKKLERQKGCAAEQKNETAADGFIEPEYTVTNQYGVDMADFSQSLTGTLMHAPNAPTSLVVSIHLPQLKSAKPCTLDVTERHLTLETSEPVKYKLSLKLSYPVNEENGSAKFDKTKKRLVVTLPVQREKLIKEINDSADVSNTPASQTQSDPQQPQLIEELPSPSHTSSSTDEGSGIVSEYSNEAKPSKPEAAEEMGEAEGQISSEADDIKLDDKIFYKVPSVNYDQDDDTVTLIIDVCRINSETLKISRRDSQMAVVFSSYSPSGFPTHYYMKAVFPDKISSIQQSLGERNMVLTITKSQAEQWTEFLTYRAGSDNEPQTHEFLTESHIEKELAQLEQLASQEVSSQGQTLNSQIADNIVVREMNSKHLSIDIQSAGTKPESSVNLEVVHKHSPPANMQSILKRTHSESGTDEPLVSPRDGITGANNDVSPMETGYIRERKKSVSFSDKVEETKFKSKDTVCQMHKTLNNRKKKKRQRENRRSSAEDSNRGRRRRNSSNSEYSSGDENTKNSGRRRRNSSGTSDEGRNYSSTQEDDDDPSEHNECKCDEDTDGSMNGNKAVVEEPLNSDDDEENKDKPDANKTQKSKSAAGWTENGSEQYMDKTKCAFDFDNSVIFDLDE